MPPLTTDDSDTTDGPRPAAAVETIRLTEELLTRRHGATVRLADPEDLGGSARSVVVRVRVAENPHSLSRTLVVKHYLQDAGDETTTDSLDGAHSVSTDRFRYEAASCQLFTALPGDDRASPALIAHDPEHRLLVMEDLGRCATLADRLRADDPKLAERSLLGWARALGRMQATTAGREDDFGALLRRFGERTRRDPLAEDARAALAEVPDQLARLLRVEAAPAAVAQARVAARLLGGTGYRAFSPSEVCPENTLVTGNGVRFLDFEWGCFRDVALTAAALRLPFLGCAPAGQLPPGLASAMTASWQAEIATVWPELAEPSVVGLRLLQAELLWVWLCTRCLLPVVVGGERVPTSVVDADPGASTAAMLAAGWRQLGTDAMARWASGAEGAGSGAVRATEATANLAASVVAALGRFGGDQDLPVFPAFARR